MKDTRWIIDPAHSAIQFKIRHLVISAVTGSFKGFKGMVETKGDNFENAHMSIFIDADSIDTNQRQRDTHLKSFDFFYIEKYPQLKFESVSIKKTEDNSYDITGNLTIREIAKLVVFKAEYGGMAKDSDNSIKAGFEITGKINRKDFGLTWNTLTDTGGLTIGEEVKVIVNVQFIKQI